MEYEELVTLYNRIVTGVVLIEYEGTLYFVHDAKPMDKQISEVWYHYVLDQFYTDGLMSQPVSEILLSDRAVWTDDMAKEMETLQKEKLKWQKDLPKYEFQSVTKKQIIKKIGSIESKLKTLHMAKGALISSTVEYQAMIERYKKLLFLLTTDQAGKRIWSDWNDFQKATDDKLIMYLLNQSFFNKTIDETSLRYLSRHEPWRSAWVAARKTGRLFDGPTSAMTDYQRIVVSWSIVYDSVFEHPDCPSEDVVENDVLMDNWLYEQSEKRKMKHGVGAAEAGTSNNISRHTEIGIVVESPEDAQRVYKLNDAANSRKLKIRENVLQKHGQIAEEQLPDIQTDLQMRRNRMGFESQKGRG